MKTVKTDVQYGSKEKGNFWELKGVEYEVPETYAELVPWLEPDKVLQTVVTYHNIRLQDLCRRLHVGGKNTAPMSDEKIRAAAQEFKLFEKVRIAAAPRLLTPAELVAQVKEGKITREQAKAQIAEYQAALDELG